MSLAAAPTKRADRPLSRGPAARAARRDWPRAMEDLPPQLLGSGCKPHLEKLTLGVTRILGERAEGLFTPGGATRFSLVPAASVPGFRC